MGSRSIISTWRVGNYFVGMSLGLAQGTVSKYLNRTRRTGLTWPLPPELDDDVRLENRQKPQAKLQICSTFLSWKGFGSMALSTMARATEALPILAI